MQEAQFQHTVGAGAILNSEVFRTAPEIEPLFVFSGVSDSQDPAKNK